VAKVAGWCTGYGSFGEQELDKTGYKGELWDIVLANARSPEKGVEEVIFAVHAMVDGHLETAVTVVSGLRDQSYPNSQETIMASANHYLIGLSLRAMGCCAEFQVNVYDNLKRFGITKPTAHYPATFYSGFIHQWGLMGAQGFSTQRVATSDWKFNDQPLPVWF
jgi:hypothetical protein